MYQVKISNKETLNFDTKESLILYFIRREPIALGMWGESKLQRYVPTLFDHVAMNPNDRYTVDVTGRAMHNSFFPFVTTHDAKPRTVMVYEDGRLIDIREWLPDFRTCLIMLKNGQLNVSCHKFYHSGHKPRYTKQYRLAHGYRQAQTGMSKEDEEDILDVLGYIPSKMKHTGAEIPSGVRPKDFQRSWKDNTKAKKGWQRHKHHFSQESIRTMGQNESRFSSISEKEYLDGIMDALFIYGHGWDTSDMECD